MSRPPGSAIPASAGQRWRRSDGAAAVPGPAHAFHPTLLREYDIRGIVGSTLGAADARAIGHAFGTILAAGGGRKVVLGYDGRLSSPELAAAAGAGLMAAGLEVL